MTPVASRSATSEGRDLIRDELLDQDTGLEYLMRLRAMQRKSPGLRAQEVGKHQVLIGTRIICALDGVIGRRQIVVAPPQTGKTFSMECAVAWLLITRPELRITWVSYAADHAERSAEQIRRMVQRYGYANGVKIVRGRNKVREFDIEQHGVPTGGRLLALGGAGSITGTPADLLIVDDAVKDRATADSPVFREKLFDAWTDNWETRVGQDGAVVGAQTRWDLDDLAGRWLSLYGVEDVAKAVPWELLHLPALADPDIQDGPDPLGRAPGEALWPAKYDVHYYEAKKAGPRRTWMSLYQGSPESPEGRGAFSKELLNKATRPAPMSMTSTIAFVDPAYSEEDNGDQTGISLIRVSERGALVKIGDLTARVPIDQVDWGEVARYAQTLELTSATGHVVPPAPLTHVIFENNLLGVKTQRWIEAGLKAYGVKVKVTGVPAGPVDKLTRHEEVAAWMGTVDGDFILAEGVDLTRYVNQAISWYPKKTNAGKRVSPDHLDPDGLAVRWQSARLVERDKTSSKRGGGIGVPGGRPGRG